MNSKGNALFLILIAVALFAALSYAVTQSGRGGGSIDKETAMISGSTVANYVARARSVVMRMRLTGCSETELSFEKSPFDGSDTDYVNGGAPGDFSCHFYHQSGGGVEELDPNSIPGLTTGSSEVEVYGGPLVPGAGQWIDVVGTAVDLTMFIRGIQPEACDQINQSMGLSQTYTDNGDLDVNPFQGTYVLADFVDACYDSTAGNCASYTDSPYYIAGVTTACFIEEDTGDRIFFSVLLER
jgi:hypothetical protein